MLSGMQQHLTATDHVRRPQRKRSSFGVLPDCREYISFGLTCQRSAIWMHQGFQARERRLVPEQ